MALEIPRLETERLILREWREEDLGPCAEMMADEDIVRYLGGEVLDRGGTWRQMATFIGHWALRGYGFWVVEDKASGDFAGRVGIWNPEGWPGIEVGWTIAKPFHRLGYATEAARASAKWAFDNLGVDHLISVILPENVASIGVAKKLGEAFDREVNVRGFDCHIYKVAKGNLIT